MLEVDRELYETLHDNGPLNNIPQELLISLEKSNFICDDNLDETMIFISKNRVTRFSNEHIRVTIMPTLNCNFRCWYCYEEHFHSQMSPEIRNASIKFCKKLIDKYNPKLFSLDWFGGEPLLYFDEIMYPIAKEIMNYCDEKRIPFSHGITTNGYLIDEDKIEKTSIYFNVPN
ncbi:radical SAM protein [Alistipes putredinis]|uniref:radical SAM protein n=1 Tax=Alistipes putredinis TaxID=28117 RepID=UPI003AF04447